MANPPSAQLTGAEKNSRVGRDGRELSFMMTPKTTPASGAKPAPGSSSSPGSGSRQVRPTASPLSASRRKSPCLCLDLGLLPQLTGVKATRQAESSAQSPGSFPAAASLTSQKPHHRPGSPASHQSFGNTKAPFKCLEGNVAKAPRSPGWGQSWPPADCMGPVPSSPPNHQGVWTPSVAPSQSAPKLHVCAGSGPWGPSL